MIRTITLSLIFALTVVNVYSQQPIADNTLSNFSNNQKMGNNPFLMSNNFYFLSDYSLPQPYAVYDSLYVLDSVNHIQYKHIRTYNSQSKLANEMVYKNVNNTFVNFQKTVYTTNISANLYQITSQKWQNNSWADERRWSYYFDSIGRVKKMVYELDWGSGQLDSTHICYRLYNSIGKISEITMISRYNNQWNDNRKSVITYDASGRINCLIDYNNNNGQFVPVAKDSVYYNSNNDITKQIYFNYYSYSGYWDKAFEKNYTYNSSGVLTLMQETLFSWTGTTYYRSIYSYNSSGLITLINTELQNNFGAWQNHKRETFTYNTQGQLISEKGELFQNNSWLNDSRNKLDYTYDANGNIATQTHIISQMNSWVPDDKIIRSYDNLNRSITGEHKVYQNNTWIPALGLLYIKDTANVEEPLSAFKYQVFYAANTTGYTQLSNSGDRITIYPNPAHSEISISNQKGTLNNMEIKIYDISGKLLLWKNYNSGDKIDISSLYRGVYFIQINTDSGIQTRRFIKE